MRYNINNRKIVITTLVLIIGLGFLNQITINVKSDITWDIEKIDIINYEIYSALTISTDIDEFGYPHIIYFFGGYPNQSYFDQTININFNSTLNYIYWNGENWINEIIAETNDFGIYNSISLDSNNNPHVCFYDKTDGDLKYAFKTNSSWNVEIVDQDGDTGLHCSIIIDGDDMPHISYYDGETPYGLMYAFRDKVTSNWTVRKIDSGYGVGYDTSINVDNDNNPAISYFDYFHNNGSLRYAYIKDQKWFFKSIDYLEDVGYSSSLVFDSDNNPHISYYDETNNGIKYATLKDDEWMVQIIENTSETSRKSFITLDANNNPHISYIVFTDDKYIKYAYWTGYLWEKQIIDKSQQSNIEIYNENPMIIYFNQNFKIAKPKLILKSPKSGETIYKEDKKTITWETDINNENLKLELYKNDELYQTITTKNISNNQYQWDISETIKTGRYILKITDNTDESQYASAIINIKNKELNINIPVEIIIIIILTLIITISILLIRKRKTEK
jgi:hypothetical protein